MVVLTRCVGLDIMDTYIVDDAEFWHHLPDGNGSWGMHTRGAIRQIRADDKNRSRKIDGMYPYKCSER